MRAQQLRRLSQIREASCSFLFDDTSKRGVGQYNKQIANIMVPMSLQLL
jgi:hypothetical protein